MRKGGLESREGREREGRGKGRGGEKREREFKGKGGGGAMLPAPWARDFRGEGQRGVE